MCSNFIQGLHVRCLLNFHAPSNEHSALAVMIPSLMPRVLCVIHSLFVLSLIPSVNGWIQYATSGTASLTHYTLPQGYIAACGCTGASTKYPTAAMSQMAYGSSAAYGPGCGRCFNLTLLDTYAPDPPFFPQVTKSVVIKVTDLCPAGGNGWCSATADKPNQSVVFKVSTHVAHGLLGVVSI